MHTYAHTWWTIVVGHVSRNISAAGVLFLCKEGTIKYAATGHRSMVLVSCSARMRLGVSYDSREIHKLMKLFAPTGSSGTVTDVLVKGGTDQRNM